MISKIFWALVGFSFAAWLLMFSDSAVCAESEDAVGDYAKIQIVDLCMQTATLAYVIELERSRYGKTYDEFKQDVLTAKPEYQKILYSVGAFVYERTWDNPTEAGRTWFYMCLDRGAKKLGLR